VRIKIYEIERHHPAQAEQLAEDPPTMMSQCHPQSVQQKKVLLVLDNPHGSRIYFFQQ